MSLGDKILQRAEDNRKKQEEQQQQEQRDFDRIVQERQRQTGQGDFGKGGSKDVHAESRATAEAKVEARRQVFDEKNRAAGPISTGHRGSSGRRTTSVTGFEPTITEAEIEAKQQEIMTERASQDRGRQAQQQATTITDSPRRGTVEFYKEQIADSRAAEQARQRAQQSFTIDRPPEFRGPYRSTTPGQETGFNPFKNAQYQYDESGRVTDVRVGPQKAIGFEAQGRVSIEEIDGEQYAYYEPTPEESRRFLGYQEQYTLPPGTAQGLSYEAYQQASREGGKVTTDRLNMQIASMVGPGGKYEEGIPVESTENRQAIENYQKNAFAQMGVSESTATDKALQKFVDNADDSPYFPSQGFGVRRSPAFSYRKTNAAGFDTGMLTMTPPKMQKAESIIKDVPKPTDPLSDFGKGAGAVGKNFADAMLATGSILMRAPVAFAGGKDSAQAWYDIEYEKSKLEKSYQPEVEGDLIGLGLKAGVDVATTGKTDVSTKDLAKIGENALSNPAYFAGSLAASAAAWLIGGGAKLSKAATAARSLRQTEKALSPLGDIAKVEKDLINIGTESSSYRYAVGAPVKVGRERGIEFATRQQITSAKDLIMPPQRLTVYTRPAVKIGERGSEQAIDLGKLPKQLSKDSPIQRAGDEFFERIEATPGKEPVYVKLPKEAKPVLTSEKHTIKELEKMLSTEAGVKKFLGIEQEQIGFRVTKRGSGGGSTKTVTETRDTFRQIINAEKQAQSGFADSAIMAGFSSTLIGANYGLPTYTPKSAGSDIESTAATIESRPEGRPQGRPSRADEKIRDNLESIVSRALAGKDDKRSKEDQKAAQAVLQLINRNPLAGTRGSERQKATQRVIGNLGLGGETGRERALRKRLRDELINDQGLEQLLTPTEVSQKFNKTWQNRRTRLDQGTLIRNMQQTGLMQIPAQTQGLRTQQALMQRFDLLQQFKIPVPTRPTRKVPPLPPLFFEQPSQLWQRARRDDLLYSERLFDVRDVLEVTFGRKQGKGIIGYGVDDIGKLMSAYDDFGEKEKKGKRSTSRRIDNALGFDFSGFNFGIEFDFNGKNGRRGKR